MGLGSILLISGLIISPLLFRVEKLVIVPITMFIHHRYISFIARNFDKVETFNITLPSDEERIAFRVLFKKGVEEESFARYLVWSYDQNGELYNELFVGFNRYYHNKKHWFDDVRVDSFFGPLVHLRMDPWARQRLSKLCDETYVLTKMGQGVTV